jgi:VanZ family protein
MNGILLLVVVLIVYGSLYPWTFVARHLNANPFVVLLNSWPTRVDVSLIKDFILNVLLYIPLGVTGFLSFSRKLRVWLAILGAVLLGCALSTSVELVQLFVPHRTTSLLDVTTNTAGSLIGAIAAWIFFPQLKSVISTRNLSWKHPAAFTLLLIWLSFQFFPLMPSYGFTRLPGKLMALKQSSWSNLEMLACFAEGLVVAVLLEVIFGAIKARYIYLALPFSLFGRLLIVGRTLGMTDLVGLTAALAIWAGILQPMPGRYSIGAVIVLATLMIRGIAPFHFLLLPTQFNWIPFHVSLGNDWLSSALVLLRKLFDYGSALWMIKITGRSYLVSTAVVAVILAIIEFVQRWLPGRAAESTDPILAIMLGFLLWRLDKERRTPGALV